MSNTKPTNRLLFLRWNLDPLAAALWQQAAKHASQAFDVRTSWIDIDPHRDPNSAVASGGASSLLDSIGECRPAALIVGIDRSRFVQTAINTRSLREFCNRLSFETTAPSKRSTEKVFLIAWFPEADRNSMLILRELGFDLVLHDPASLRVPLAKIVHIDTVFDVRSISPNNAESVL